MMTYFCCDCHNNQDMIRFEKKESDRGMEETIASVALNHGISIHNLSAILPEGEHGRYREVLS